LLGKFITYAPGAIVFQSGVIFTHKAVFNYAGDYTKEMHSSLLSSIMPSTHQKLDGFFQENLKASRTRALRLNQLVESSIWRY
jgi:hypothetical protein